MKKDIGLGVKTPEKACHDVKCPFHGRLPVRGRVFKGKVLSDRASKTVVVQWDYLIKNPKYERFARRRTKIVAHNPSCISATVGDTVEVAECRPLSKTKKFVVVRVSRKGKPEEIAEIEDSKLRLVEEKKEEKPEEEPKETPKEKPKEEVEE